MTPGFGSPMTFDESRFRSARPSSGDRSPCVCNGWFSRSSVRIRLGAPALLCFAACAHPTPPAAPSLSPFQVEEPVTAAIAAALAADGRGESADSLWDPEATVIADGELRDDAPRFAGVAKG